MKLKDIIANVDKSEKNSDYVNLEELANEVGINQWLSTPDDCRIKSYFFFKWYCTDTYVGGRVYFLDEKPVAVSWQSGRKCSEVFEWISQELFNEVHKYIVSLMEPAKPEIISLADLEEDWGIGHKVEYGSQLLAEDVFCTPENTMVKVVKKFNDYKDVANWQFIMIDTPTEKNKKVSMDDILVPYNLKQHKEI